ncbi:MAG: branched-chain amino acid ABC transporter substrate-binding protein [Desulfobacterales bacterium]|nr:MAG: branched-chain amino acid ABC transporter substrate-binding protein [Desulfobacterales bacterium]
MSKSIKVLAVIMIVLMFIGATGFFSGALAKQKVKIGFIGPLTGGNASMGLGGRNSFLLAVRQYNRGEFGPKKYEYEAVVEDDSCIPATGVRVATKMASNPSIIAGASHYCSMVGIATKPVFTQYKYPSMIWGAVLPAITIPSPKYITRVNGTQREQNVFHAAWSRETVKEVYKKAPSTYVVIHDITDYGRGHAEYFIDAVEKLEGKILAKMGITIGQKDFSAELTKAKALNPNVIFFGGLTPEGARLRIQMQKLGIKAGFEGTSGILNEDFIKTTGPEVAEGSMCFGEGAPFEKLPGGKEFFSSYQKEGFKDEPEFYGIFAYIAAQLIMDAIEEVGPDRDKVADKLAQTDRASSAIGPIKFDKDGQNILPVVTAYVAQDGKWTVWEDSEYASGKRVLPTISYIK